MIAATEKATREQSKRHNNRLVLKTVYDRGMSSRAELARITNLTATTVSATIAELITDGLVEEVGSVSTERGKPPTLIRLAKDARHLIALDLSRSVFRGAILNLRGEVIQQKDIVVDGQTGEVALAAVYQLIDALLPAVKRPLLGIGIGAPGIIDYNSGIIRQAANLDWYNLPLSEQLAKHYDLAVHIVNDNQAVLLAEFIFGQYKNSSELVVIRVGHGIGAGIMVNGQLLHGYATGEIGHVVVVDNGERCSCGNYGCLETVASNRAIVKRARTMAELHPESSLNQLTAMPEEITIDTVMQAFKQGDPLLTELMADVGHYLGVVIAHLVGVLGTPPILLCGRVARFGKPLLDVIEYEVCTRSLTGRLNRPKIDIVSLKAEISDIVILGAAASLLTNELGLF
ncbi:MAG: ROK family transcriptional regulator [Chloroflexi bacterium]|nr:ROK family transcriptional regulator [Chloroflexota bacterium]